MKNTYKLIGLVFDKVEIPKDKPTVIDNKVFKSNQTIQFSTILSCENIEDFFNLLQQTTNNSHLYISVDIDIKNYNTLKQFYAKRLLQSISILKSISNNNFSIYSNNLEFRNTINKFYIN